MPQEPDTESEALDISHDLDMVALFNSSNHDAEMEAMAIQGILQASDIPCVLVGSSTLPMLNFEVQVPREKLDDARRILAEAQSGGPAAAAEAEAASEDTP